MLTPTHAKLEQKVRGVYNGDEDDFPWEIRQGRAGYTAIIEYRPGYQDADGELLAEGLSRGATKPTYLMRFDDDAPRVTAFVKGTYVGEVSAWPDDVARQLGCTFPQRLTGRGKVDLTPRKMPEAKRGERKIAGFTIAQWKHMIQYSENWSAVLDAATERDALAALHATGHKDPGPRATACKLAGVLGLYAFGAHASEAVTRLRSRAREDSVEEVRLEAREAAESLAQQIATQKVRSEFPWLLNFDREALPKALEALDDEREPVRRETYGWWAMAWEVPAEIGGQAKKKLEHARKRERSKETRDMASWALQNVRAEIREDRRRRQLT